MSQDSNEKQAAYEALVKKGIPSKDASLMAGYSPLVNQDRPTKKIAKALEKAGVTDDRLAKAVREGLEAKNRFGGSDHNAIVKYLGIAGKWLGHEKESVNLQVGLNFQGQVTDPSRLADAIKLVEAEINGRDSDKVNTNDQRNEGSKQDVVNLTRGSGTDTFEESPTEAHTKVESDIPAVNP